MRIISCIAALFMATLAFAQEPEKKSNSEKVKGLYIYWGWNRGWYTHSDIRFQGNDYDFTLQEVIAKDRQTPFKPGIYFNPVKLTIPQSNLRIGYRFNKHWNISFGDDHMKYVMVQNQKVKINGVINGAAPEFDKTYHDEEIELTNDFLLFEHTDGLNYLNVELRRVDNLYTTPGKKFAVNVTEGGGGGILFPRTNTTLLGKERYDEYHVAGYGTAAMAGLNLTFFDLFFIQHEWKGGYINMPDIRTTKFKSDKASQHFLFLQTNFVFGFNYRFK